MPKQLTPKNVESVKAFKQQEDRRKTIPTAEFQVVMAEEEQSSVRAA